MRGGGGLFALGSAILGGAAATTGVTLAAGFAAGFVGSIASQGVAKALGMQDNVNFKGALISGLATAATGGLLHGLNKCSAYSGAMKTLLQYAENNSRIARYSGRLEDSNLLSFIENSLANQDYILPHGQGALAIENKPDLYGIGKGVFALAQQLDGSEPESSLSFIENNLANQDYILPHGKGALAIENKPGLYGIGNGVFGNKEVVTAEQLKTMFPRAKQKLLDDYLVEFNSQLYDGGINTPKRLAYFFATVNVETKGMTEFVENDFTYKKPQYAKATFKSKLGKMSLEEIKALGNGELFANTVYGGEYGNGDVASGDGYFYRGRGLFHHTFKDNYRNLDERYVKDPDLVLIPSNGVKAAIKYWGDRRLTAKVDVLSLNIPILEQLNKDGDPEKYVPDEAFNNAVKAVNGGTSNIVRRASSYNYYLKLFQQ